jgi:hypothetical protein
MNEQSFSLIPFPGPNHPDIVITGKVSFQNHLLALQYSLTGKVEDVFLPPASPIPRRTDELWKSTCFEFFLAIKDRPAYWEFNLSPSGDWNIFHMDAYRRVGFREERSIQYLQIEAHKETKIFTLNATIDLKSIFQTSELLEIGITAIIQTKDGNQSYWALTHPGHYPDFHLRESFILGLEGQTHLLEQSAPGD